MRISRALPWVLLVVLVVFTATVYASLPAEIPRNVDFSGRVTETVPKTPLTWALLPIVAIVAQLGVEAIRRALPSKPELFNFPGKDDLLKLPVDMRVPIIGTMQWFLDMVSCLTNGIFMAVQAMMWHAARGGNSQNSSMVILMITVLTTPVILLLLQRVTNQVDAAKRVWESRRNPLAS